MVDSNFLQLGGLATYRVNMEYQKTRRTRGALVEIASVRPNAISRKQQ